MQPENFDAHYNLANALVSQDRYLEAIEHYRAAIRLHPDDANAEANLGAALAETGKVSEAKVHLQRALRIDPHHKLARENLDQINQDPRNQKQ
jgi:tetratricopeptide (TPR) repeat protein